MPAVWLREPMTVSSRLAVAGAACVSMGVRRDVYPPSETLLAALTQLCPAPQTYLLLRHLTLLQALG